MKLNAKTVAAASLPHGKADAIHFDDDLPGFGYRLRAGAGGKVLRSYVAQYRRAGATRRVLLGSAEVLTAEQARQAARKVLAAVALGQDPQADKADRRDKDRASIRAVVDQYLAVKRGEVRPKTFVEIARYLTDKAYFGPLHGMPIDQVTQRDVASCLLAISQRGAVTTTQARSTLQAFYVWALHMGIALTNPVMGTRKPREAMPRERVLSDDELRRIWNGCDDDDYGRVIKLLILTGARRQEVGGMAWPEIDFERDVWTLPASRSKNKRSHTLPLAAAAFDIIKTVPRMGSREHLFGAHSNKGFANWDKGKQALDARCGVAGWVVHDVRRSVATRLADLAVPPHIVEQILNHQSGHRRGVAGVYNKSTYAIETRNALALWSDHIASIVSGGRPKVIPLRG